MKGFFNTKKKTFFAIFKGLSFQQIFLEAESPTLKQISLTQIKKMAALL